ncbi:HNH endonuclease family protein [Corynebacterium liangguodongii]|uniref:HNH endonuclease n=1 Tax=Corynebacterium liangguodongii TaxID=2079535 RepID=A0A2S0WDH8_9CORY|nr:HNH endonuclease family protein [Corynebacterium liangguodongii]AWB83810.1 HNH endonuclease [Corynebacterium liangguodongii]PWB98931.1 HNH endonuclease [Corynebacterium liangguodongii]
MRTYLCLLIALTVAVVPFPTPLTYGLAAHVPSTPQRARVIGYERDAFGPGWAPAPGGCDTRSALMAAAFGAASCGRRETLSASPITDPYTGSPLDPAEVEIDHVYPLAAAWDLGAHAWSADKRVAFANDPRNLVVTSAKANREKSDHLPSEWLPPRRRAHCPYARQLVAVAQAYGLALPRADARAARRACAGLRGVLSDRAL